MKCYGNFVYKGIKKRDAGEFTGEDGRKIQYNECFVLKVDDEQANERTFKIPAINTALKDKFASLNMYSAVEIVFDFEFRSNGYSLTPVNVQIVKAHFFVYQTTEVNVQLHYHESDFLNFGY